MTSQSFEDPESIKHFQSMCDACQELILQHHSPCELKLYVEGYTHALRKTQRLNLRDQEKLETLINTWIKDPSSFLGPDGDISRIYVQ